MVVRTALVAALVLAALPGTAQAGPAGPRARLAQAGERRAFLAHHLKLSEAQKTQMKEVHARHQESLKAKRGAAQEAREAFRKAAQDPASSPEQLRRLHQTVSDRQFEVMLEQRSVRMESRALLSPEQRTEADRLRALGEEHRRFRMDRMKGFMEGRGGRGFRPGGGPGPGSEFPE